MTGASRARPGDRPCIGRRREREEKEEVNYNQQVSEGRERVKEEEREREREGEREREHSIPSSGIFAMLLSLRIPDTMSQMVVENKLSSASAGSVDSMARRIRL